MKDLDFRISIRMGLIGGACLILVSAIGMVETFHGRLIVGGLISMGQSLLIALLLAVCFSAAKQAATKKGFSVLGAALAGLVSTAVLCAFILTSLAVNLRQVFVNVSPTLINILAFGKICATADVCNLQMASGFGSGVLLLLIYGAAFGALAGVLYILPTRVRSAVFNGLLWVAILGLLGELIRTVLTGRPILGAVQWMLGTRVEKGLSQAGAATIFLVVAGLSFVMQQFGGRVSERTASARSRLNPRAQRGINLAAGFVALALIWQLPNFLGLYLSEVANTVGLFILMGLGLNIVVGFAGLLDLGYVAFFAIGAYVMGFATSSAVGQGAGQIVASLGLTFWQALPLVLVASFLAGVILGIPVLKMRGDYLAIVTLGFGEIIRILAISDVFKPNLGGSQGIVQVAPILIGGQNFSRPTELFHLILIGCLLVGFVAWRLKDSRLGRAWKAMREDEDVASAMGISLVPTKLLAFASGATFSGLAGAIFASKLGSIYPHSFNLLVSINILSLVIIGGMGSIPGVVVGALALVGLPELLREFAEYRLLVFGAALVLMMLTKPEGLLPEETHRRELHEDENIPGEQAA
ncbi:MAG: branched-chain amino acid ABC transporter permease [Anaerolineales bacterium]